MFCFLFSLLIINILIFIKTPRSSELPKAKILNSSINFSQFAKLKEPTNEILKTDPEALKPKSILSSSPKEERKRVEREEGEEDGGREEVEEEGGDDLICEPSFDGEHAEKDEDKKEINVWFSFFSKI